LLVERIVLNGLTDGTANECALHWAIRNYGKSPAWLRSIAVQGWVGKELPPVPPMFPEVQELRHAVAPQQAFKTRSWDAAKIPVTLRNKQLIISERTNLYIFGCVEYADTFGDIHRSNFAYRAEAGEHGTWDKFGRDGPAVYWKYT
jgi:hypothetical protein